MALGGKKGNDNGSSVNVDVRQVVLEALGASITQLMLVQAQPMYPHFLSLRKHTNAFI